MDTANNILTTEFNDRLNWSLEKLEEACYLIGSLNNKLINLFHEYEQEQGHPFQSVLDFNELENKTWAKIKEKYPNPIYPEYHIKIIMNMSEKERQVYEENIKKSECFFKNKALELKIQIHRKLNKTKEELNI